MKTINLTQGKKALVDDKDHGWLSKFKWFAHKDKKGRWYAKRGFRTGKKSIIFVMHKVIMKAFDMDKEVAPNPDKASAEYASIILTRRA